MSIIMIGLDTPKPVYQVHSVNETGYVEIRRELRRSELFLFFEKQEACAVVMEACAAPITGRGVDARPEDPGHEDSAAG